MILTTLRNLAVLFLAPILVCCGAPGGHFSDSLNHLRFGGITGLERAADGSVIIHVDTPSAEGQVITDLTMDLYLDAINGDALKAAAGDLVPITTAPSIDASTGSLAGATTAFTGGYALQSQTGQGYFRVDPLTFRAGVTYALQVAARANLSSRFEGPTALFLRPGGPAFKGITALAFQNGRLNAAWDAADPNSVEGAVTYYVYAGSDFKTQVAATTETSVSLDQVTVVPNSSPAFGVRAVDQRLFFDQNTVVRSIAIGSLPLTFGGLEKEHVVYKDGKITLSWEPAINASGELKYIILNFGKAIGSPVATTNYTIPNVDAGDEFVLSVKAKDDSGVDDNTKFVSVTTTDAQ